MIYVVFFCIVMACYFNTRNTPSAHNPTSLAWIMFGLAMVVGMGDMLGGYDRYIYGELFDRNADIVEGGQPIFNNDNPLYVSYSSEFFYVYWFVLVAHVTSNRYIFILLSTFFMFTLIYYSIRDYIESNYFFAVLAFMGIWFFFSHTYLRQAMATSVAWFGMRYVVQRKPWKFFLCAFIVYKFHNSGIVYSFLYFMPIKKWTKKQVIYAMILLFLTGITGLTSSLYSLYGDMSDDDRNKGYNNDDTGGRLAYLIEVVVFLYFIFKRYNRIRSRKDIVFLNAALCFCGMLLFFFRSSNGGRQSWYFAMGIIYLLTELSNRDLQFKRVDDYTKCLLGILFALYLRIVIAWGSLLSPYKTFLTNGYRKNDTCCLVYEYDWNYERDKMYRKPFRLIWNHWM